MKRFSGSLQYILRDKTPVAVEDTLLWAKWFGQSYETEERVVAKTVIHDYEISTVFLGLDHNFLLKGPPIVFETMVFRLFGEIRKYEITMPDGTTRVFEHDRESVEDIDGYTRRYATWEEAEQGHEEVVKLVKLLYMKLVVNGGRA